MDSRKKMPNFWWLVYLCVVKPKYCEFIIISVDRPYMGGGDIYYVSYTQ